MTLSEAEEYIADIPRFTSKNRPENTVELLRRLGHPEDHFRVIHVAGTNGKGSVCAFLESILRQQGYRTGLFTSPHLVDVRERFQISREYVSEDGFVHAFENVLSAVRDMEKDSFPHPSYFEFLFAMGMIIFRQAAVDVLVMETGLGGRLDATNSVRHPDLTVITSISFDHMQYLGSTLEEIAGEKAGIIKAKVPVVADAFSREAFDPGKALAVIRAKAEEMKAPLTVVSDRMTTGKEYDREGIRFTFNNDHYDHVRVRIPFFADYQIENCAVAMTAAAVFGRMAAPVSERSVLEGVRKTRWMGRMEQIRPGVIVDGAHNADGIDQFLRTAKRLAEKEKVYLLFSAVSDKDIRGMIREIAESGIFSFVVTTETGGDRRVPAAELAEIFRRYGKAPVCAVPDAGAALERSLENSKDGILFCAGSLYLAGEIESRYDQLRGRTEEISSVHGRQ